MAIQSTEREATAKTQPLKTVSWLAKAAASVFLTLFYLGPLTSGAPSAERKEVVWSTSLPKAVAERLANAYKARNREVTIKVESNWPETDMLSLPWQNFMVTASRVLKTSIVDSSLEVLFGRLKRSRDPFKLSDKSEGLRGVEFREAALLAALPVLLAYNKATTDAKFVVNSWDALENRKLSGRLAIMEPTLSASGQAQYAFWTNKLGYAPFASATYPTASAQAAALATGEAQFAVMDAASIYTFTQAGKYPFEPIWPKEGTVAFPLVIWLTTYGAGQDDAKAFLRFLLSKEGQAELKESLPFTVAIRHGVSQSKLVASKLASGVPIYVYYSKEACEALRLSPCVSLQKLE